MPIDYAALARQFGGSVAPLPMPSGATDGMMAPSHGDEPEAVYNEEVQRAKDFASRIVPVPMPFASAAMPTGGGAAVTGAVGRAASMAKGAVKAVAPQVTYEATRRGMEAFGAPPWLSVPAATAVSVATGGGMSKRTLARTARPSASPVSPSASTPVAPIPEAVPSVSPAPAPAPTAGPGAPQSAPTPPAGSIAGTPHPSAGTWSPQRIANELGIWNRRLGAKLTDQEYAAAESVVSQGLASPQEAVAQIAKMRAPAVPQKFKLNAAESKVYQGLRQAGKSHQDAAQIIEQQRDLAARLGTPSPESVRQEIAGRVNNRSPRNRP